MGSLVSVPKISTTPQPQQSVRYVQTVSAPSTSSQSSSSSTPTGSSSSGSSTTESIANIAATREDNLLRRSRGLSSTIQTSFRGLLGMSDEPQRKTLLGE